MGIGAVESEKGPTAKKLCFGVTLWGTPQRARWRRF
jgi:hypothetical protein